MEPERCKLLRSLMLALVIGVAPAAAQQPAPAAGPEAQDPTAPKSQDPAVEELRRRVEVLAAEIEQLRSADQPQQPAIDAERRRTLGLGPAAASVYERKSGVSFAGYGEMLFERQSATDQS